MVVTTAARIMNNKTESPMIKFKQPSKKTSTNDGKDDNDNDNDNDNVNNKKNTKKRVKFSPTVSVETTISLYDMTDEEIEKTWNSIEEENDIRRRCRELMAAAAAYDDESDDEHSNNSVEMRGLENIKQRRSNRCVAQEEVFEEQDQQNLPYCFGNGNGGYFLNDDEKIASVYKMHTTKCTISARLMAIKDRIEIENYLLFCNN
jgi:hypothetical protein